MVNYGLFPVNNPEEFPGGIAADILSEIFGLIPVGILVETLSVIIVGSHEVLLE